MAHGDITHIDRGYQDFAAALCGLGADVVREPDPDQYPNRWV